MSVNMSIGDYRFNVKAENKAPALAAFNTAFQGWLVKNLVKNGEAPPETLEDAFELMKWMIEIDADGNIDNILFQETSMGENCMFMETIAPWVEAGSYLCVVLDNDPSRWYFDGKQMLDQGVSYTVPDDSKAD